MAADAALQLEQKFPRHGSNLPRSIATGLCWFLLNLPSPLLSLQHCLFPSAPVLTQMRSVRS